MDANLLANLLECDSWYKLVTREEIANTLRQQANRIEELEKYLHMVSPQYDQLDKDTK